VEIALLIFGVELQPYIIDSNAAPAESGRIRGDVAPFNVTTGAGCVHPLSLIGDARPTYGTGAVEEDPAGLHRWLPADAARPGSAVDVAAIMTPNDIRLRWSA
jgi:hypothetical protein